MNSEATHTLAALLIVASVLVYPASVKAHLLGWLGAPVATYQIAARASLLTLASFLLHISYGGSGGALWLLATFVLFYGFGIVLLTWLCGALGEIIAEKLFPEFRPERESDIDEG